MTISYFLLFNKETLYRDKVISVAIRRAILTIQRSATVVKHWGE